MINIPCLSEPTIMLLYAIGGLILGCTIVTAIFYPKSLGRIIALICALPIIILWNSIIMVILLICYIISNLIFLGIYGATGDNKDVKDSWNIVKWIKNDDIPWFKIHLKTPHEKILREQMLGDCC